MTYLVSCQFCNKRLSTLIEIWMKIYLVSDSNCKHCKPIMPKLFLRGMTGDVWCTFSVDDTTHGAYN